MTMLKKCISVLLIISLIMMFCVPAHAFAPALITPAVAIEMIITTLIVAIGIKLDTDVELNKAVDMVWARAGENVRTMLEDAAALGSDVITWTGEQWAVLVQWLRMVFPSADIESIGGLFDAQISNVSVSAIDAVDLLVYDSVPKVPQLLHYSLGTLNVDYEITSNNTNITIYLDDGHYFSTSNQIDSALTSTYDINICYPFVTDYSGYWQIFFPMKLRYSGTTWHKYANTNWFYDGNGLYRNSTGIYYSVGGNVIYLDDTGTYNSIPHYMYDLLAGLTTLPLDVDADIYDGVTSIPIDGSVDVTINVPDSIPDALAANPADLLTVDAASEVPEEFPETSTSDDTANKFRIPAQVLMDKFPFCIPFDVMRTFEILRAPEKIPHFEIPFTIQSLGISETIVIDFAQFDKLAQICRWFFSIIFLLGLILITRKLIM